MEDRGVSAEKAGDSGLSSIGRGVLTTAGLVVIIAGFRAAASIVLPFLVAAFIALISTPPLFWLKRKGVPSGLAVLIVLAGLLATGIGAGTLVGSSLNDFYQALPSYQASLQEQVVRFYGWLEGLGLDLPESQLNSFMVPGAVMQMAGRIVSGLGALVANMFTILITIVFILLEASSFPSKLRAAIGDPQASFQNFDVIVSNVNRYLVIKTMVSAATGLTAGFFLAVLGIDFPVLWGLMTFLLNYIPTFGSIIAALPPISLGLIQYGPGTALLVLVGYLACNLAFGSFLEPRLMGRGLAISPLVVLVSLFFWNWMLGPIGMLLSVPLTMTVKIILESRGDTRWAAILLGSASEARSGLEPPGPSEQGS